MSYFHVAIPIIQYAFVPYAFLYRLLISNFIRIQYVMHINQNNNCCLIKDKRDVDQIDTMKKKFEIKFFLNRFCFYYILLYTEIND